MSDVLVRWPNCGMTQAAFGECEPVTRPASVLLYEITTQGGGWTGEARIARFGKPLAGAETASYHRAYAPGRSHQPQSRRMEIP